MATAVSQGLPLLVLLHLPVLSPHHSSTYLPLAFVGTKFIPSSNSLALLFAIAPSYDLTQAKAGWLFWLSPLADPLAVLRIFLSAKSTPTQWRGRSYGQQQ
jgi:dolichol-phosphate mannosyltransferase